MSNVQIRSKSYSALQMNPPAAYSSVDCFTTEAATYYTPCSNHTCCAMQQYIGMLMRTLQMHAVLNVHSSVVIQVYNLHKARTVCLLLQVLEACSSVYLAVRLYNV
jgi:hypothetical protein